MKSRRVLRILGAQGVGLMSYYLDAAPSVEACYICHNGSCLQALGESGAYGCGGLLQGGCMLWGNNCMSG